MIVLKNNMQSSVISNKTVRYAAYYILLFTLFLFGCSKEEAVPVHADFRIEIVNNDYSIPVQVKIINTTIGADTYNWTFTGANPSISTKKNPGTIIYLEAGNYTITLEASNRDDIHGSKAIEISINAEVLISFNTEIIGDNFPPMEVALHNTSVGADTFNWTFQNGNPLASTNQHPDNITFSEPGEHTITLEISNGLETYQTQQTVTVAPHLVAAFNYEVAFEDEDLQVPVTLTMLNNSISATNYNWTFSGGSPNINTDKNPTVTFNTPGTYTLNLEASNSKTIQTASKTITVVPNTNIRTFHDLKLGINTAHNSNNIGAFFSTITSEVYKKEDVSAENEALIDIAFFGLNKNFNFNKFVSPDQVQTLTFDALPNATHTKFINSQEFCACSASMTTAQFDAIIDDTLLKNLTITETTGGLQEFNKASVPRIVLFETEDGRKGAIKIKDFVADSTNSYIIIDIKVQKE